MRELIPRQVDKKSEVPKEEKGVRLSKQRQRSGILKEKERTNIFFFFSTFLSLSHIKDFFSLSQELMITQQTTQFKLCTKDWWLRR